MNRMVTNEIVVVIGAALIIAAVRFAWVASKPAEMAKVEPSLDVDPHAQQAFGWQSQGETVYESRCASCHGDGERTQRVPSLRGHMANLLLAREGRTYLIDFILQGFTGRLEVGSEVYDARHPVYKDRLTNEEIAAVLNHCLVSWGNREHLPEHVELYRPEEVAERRRQSLTPVELQEIRHGIELSP